MPARKLTDDQVRELHAQYVSGLTSVELGKQMGVSAPCITRRFRKLRLPMRRRKLSDRQVRDLHDLYLAGSTSKQLSARAGLPYFTIQRHFKRLGLRLRP